MKLTYHKEVSLPSNCQGINPIILHPSILEEFIKMGAKPQYEVYTRSGDHYTFIYAINLSNPDDLEYDRIDVLNHA